MTEQTMTVRAEEEMIDEFDFTITQLKAERRLPQNFSRSHVIREFLAAAADDPSLIEKVVESPAEARE